ncbi:hypothetical protein AB1L30_21125 [Bremerella sp. JC817]|uniref:hypothetical protein n=1 Tax=Bremerella sp. JC817 TaxID=3231756 RepID=UPI0034584F46
MATQKELDRGYPQTDPNAKSPPATVNWLAIVLVTLGLIAGLVVIGPIMAIWQAN